MRRWSSSATRPTTARAAAALPRAEVFRPGGDEFCVVMDEAADGETGARIAAEALTESGETFEVRCSYGIVLVPAEAAWARFSAET